MKKFTVNTLIVALLISVFGISCKKKPELPLKMRLENEILDCNYIKIETLFKENEPLSEKELIELAEFAYNKKCDFKTIQLICENGLSVNTSIFEESDGFKYSRTLLQLAIRYRRDDFINYIIEQGITKESLYTDNGYNLLSRILVEHHGEYFSEILNSLSPEILEQIDLIDLIDNLWDSKNQKNIDSFFSNKKIIEILQQDEKLVDLIVRNYSTEMVNEMRKYLDFSKLNYSGTSALQWAISSHNIEAIRMLFDNGVSPDSRLEWMEGEILSIIDFAHFEIKLRNMTSISEDELNRFAEENRNFISELENLINEYKDTEEN